MPITIRGRESLQIPEGLHPAKITGLKVEKRGKDKTYEYIDVHVDVMDVKTKDGKHPNIKMGMPFDLSVNTQLGHLLKAFGVTDEQITGGESMDLEKVLSVGRNVKIVTTDVTTDKGTFAEIQSMKPA
jgi:hypothetical protein